MKRTLLDALVMPGAATRFEIATIESEEAGEIKEGCLQAVDNRSQIRISNFIPRFVKGSSYVDNFGLQWNHFRRVQIDSKNNFSLTKQRFYANNKWVAEDLKGLKILDAGCGAGRFAEIALSAGAEVYAVDYSSSVDAAWANLSTYHNLHLVQADIYALPFQHGYFDRIYCYGVLQHTPAPKEAFLSLPSLLKTGGYLSVDCYIRPTRPDRYTSKYLWRPVTRRLPPRLLLRFVEWYIPRWLPIDTRIARVPKLGRLVTSVVPCWNYTGHRSFALTPEQIRDWAILDTFDALSATYDNPQTLPTLRSWFEEAGFGNIHVERGGNGIIGNGQK
jgi:2-polyprenyl-3-methyl-5-hydroxy-6-metoxy-1,4-benzoquinol methylase